MSKKYLVNSLSNGSKCSGQVIGYSAGRDILCNPNLKIWHPPHTPFQKREKKERLKSDDLLPYIFGLIHSKVSL